MTIYYCTSCERAHSNVLPLPCKTVWCTLDKPAGSCYVRAGLAGGTLDVSSSAQRARADDARPQCTADRELSADIFLLDTPVRSVRSWTVDDATFDAFTDAIEHPRAPSDALIALFRKR